MSVQSESTSFARRMPARTALAVGALATVLSLSACFTPPIPNAGDDPDESTAVDFDGVQSATIQLEARGTFVDPQYGGYEAAGRGSGFIISSDGIAVTNNHVVVGAGTIDVWRGGDTTETLHARVLGSSECLDLAVVQLEEGTYPRFAWHKGDITTAMDVYAAGFPLGDPTFTMTRGIVSKAQTGGETPWASLDAVIEHDARIRPGNSGGPLVDEDGRLVGVNYAVNNEFDTNLAIHRDEVLEVIDQLIAGENVLSLGINAQALMGEEGGLGIWVSSVAAGSAADKAGIEPGDLITRLQGVSVGVNGTLTEYCDVLRTHGADATLDIELFRPNDGLYHRGQVNGDPIEAVQVVPHTEEPTGEFVDVQDDTGSVFVQVPAAWSQLDGAPFTDGQGNNWVGVTASPDIASFTSSWNTPGVSVLASAGALANTTVDDLIGTASGVTADGCVSEGPVEYADGYHTGAYEYYTDCGPNGAGYLVLAAVADSGNYLIYVTVQVVTESDLAAVDRVLGSFYADL
jgi:serine protease Do